METLQEFNFGFINNRDFSVNKHQKQIVFTLKRTFFQLLNSIHFLKLPSDP